MELNLHTIETRKTARFFTRGQLNHETRYVWLMLHGYAQTADHLLQSFKSFSHEHFIIAPEGLNHFYAKGFTGAPVASWMTSLMREHEIKDYLAYLNLLHSKFEIPSHCKLIVLGFSQGVTTLSRWINDGICIPHHLVMIAGNLANELEDDVPQIFRVPQHLYLYGDADSLISTDTIQKTQKLLGPNTQFVKFEGKHEINESCIKAIVEWLRTI